MTRESTTSRPRSRMRSRTAAHAGPITETRPDQVNGEEGSRHDGHRRAAAIRDGLVSARAGVLPAQTSFDAFMSSRRDGAGAQFRRRLRWLEGRSDFSFERLTSGEDVAHAFGEFLALHRERWSERNGGDGISTPALEAFHRQA